ncbi:uncharacterized protein GGS25DRAFT_529363 [Hypoxylon fragiforme]|uniref:uncharacterized protein n=1 Tax=Hypoxylon fragiforme TaxID=63214 RepID=UPI0020C742A1|nr:uncharacterized protein GGS25DRAFT_529363 [Hypoxylon fragiforme]KAI2612817.1 hypothetical protein GGS25DRAFT_529363 [Hypoxylon fragiforme]
MQMVSSSEQFPAVLVSDESYYRNQHVSSGGPQASYTAYSTTTPSVTSENMMGYQSQPLPPTPVQGNARYVAGGHTIPDVNIGLSSTPSFSPPAVDPFDYSYYQAVPAGSRSLDTGEPYHHGYSTQGGYGAVAMTSPPPSSSSKKQKHASSRSTTTNSNSNNHNKRSKSAQQVFSPGSTTSSTSNHHHHHSNKSSRLRSASRTSKNTHHNPPSTAEEQKSRDTHNQVEKQYRNRLNAHFESLLDALPENMQAGEVCDENPNPNPNGDGEGLMDLSDRRVSKAEVLDMARRHIQALERECAALEGERDELRSNVARLRWLFGRYEGAEGWAGEQMGQGQMGGFPDPGGVA